MSCDGLDRQQRQYFRKILPKFLSATDPKNLSLNHKDEVLTVCGFLFLFTYSTLFVLGYYSLLQAARLIEKAHIQEVVQFSQPIFFLSSHVCLHRKPISFCFIYSFPSTRKIHFRKFAHDTKLTFSLCNLLSFLYFLI